MESPTRSPSPASSGTECTAHSPDAVTVRATYPTISRRRGPLFQAMAPQAIPASML